MIFYSEDIIKGFETQEQIDGFNADVEMIFTYFTYPKISLDYIRICKTNHAAFYCINNDKFVIRNCPSCMIYSRGEIADCSYNYYYILLMCTHRRFKNMGYATMLLDGFIESVKHSNADKKTKFILSSVDEAVSYYQCRGFVAVDYSLENYPELMRFEKFEKDKMYTVMEMII